MIKLEELLSVFHIELSEGQPEMYRRLYCTEVSK